MLCEELSRQDGTDWRLVNICAAEQDITDKKGLPWMSADGSESRWIPVGDLRALCTTEVPTILQVEDLGQASEAVQAAWMPTIHPTLRKVGEDTLSPCVAVIANTNRPEDAAGVEGIISPLADRFAAVYYVEPDPTEVADYLDDHGYCPFLSAFVRYKGASLVAGFEPTDDLTRTPTPRGLELCGQLMAAIEERSPGLDLTPAICGAIGRPYGQEFLAYRELVHELPSPEQVMADPDGTDIPEKGHMLFAMASRLAGVADQESFGTFLRYVERWPRAEFQVLFVRAAIRREPTTSHTKAFSRWTQENSDVLLGRGV
jgi:hypothetical protein